MPANLSGAHFKITGIVLHKANAILALSKTISEPIDYLTAS